MTGRRQPVVLLSLFISVQVCLASSPDRISWVSHFAQAVPEQAGLTNSLQQLLSLDDLAADLAIVTYHARSPQPVIQLYRAENPAPPRILNPDGVLSTRLGEGWHDPTEKFLGLILQPARYLGSPAVVRRQQRAVQLAVNGDLSLLREQTIEPLTVVAILARADRYLPVSLRAQVKAVILTAELGFTEWRGQLQFIVDDPRQLDRVGNTLAAWRDLAASLVDAYAGHATSQRLRAVMDATTVRQLDDRIVVTGTLPALAVVRVAKEAAGRNDGCLPGSPCPSDKIAICHHESPTNHQTLCVTPSDVSLYLSRGDDCGPCRSITNPPTAR